MRILVDIGHPAHVHVFKNCIQSWMARGEHVRVTSRRKECATELLDALRVEHTCLSESGSGSVGSLFGELVSRNRALAQQVRQFGPDVLCAVGGIFAAQVGFISRTPSVVFYDTEIARLQNLLTYPAASRVVVPRCYGGWVPARRTTRYAGYHELAYLHPDVFAASRAKALECGLAPEGETFLVRMVSWQANHDLNLKGWRVDDAVSIVRDLAQRGRVIISSEGDLPEPLAPYRYEGSAADIHHLLAYCRAYIGESATMASEASVLGVPAVYAAPTRRGYTDEQESRYGLSRTVLESRSEPVLRALDDLMRDTPERHQGRRRRLLAECENVTEVIDTQVRRAGEARR